MTIIGRYEKVSIWYPHSGKITAPYILDKKQQLLKPAEDRYWWKSPEGIWLPTVAGGVGNDFSGGSGSGIIIGPTELDGSVFSPVVHNLDSAYTAGSAGDAVGFRFNMTENKTLTDVYFSIFGYLGTAANVNDINIEIYGHDAVNNKPDYGSGALATGSVDPSSVSGAWITLGSLSVSLTAGNYYWFVVGDADGNTTDRARLTHSTTTDNSGQVPWYSRLSAATTTNGWTSVILLQTNTACFVIGFSDGSALGFPFLGITAAASDTNQKGLLLNNGFTGNARIYGVVQNDADNNMDSVNIWEGSSGPSGTPFAQTSVFVRSSVSSAAVKGGFIFTGTKPLLSAGTTYRIVFQPGASAVDGPDVFDVGSVSDANIRAAFPGGGDWYSTVESGGSWSDDQDTFPMIGIMIDSIEPSSGGGGETTPGRSFPTLS